MWKEEHKSLIINNQGVVITVFGLITGTASLVSLFQLNLILLSCMLIFFIVISIILIQRYLNHIKLHRESSHFWSTYHNGYKGTHNSWHEFNRLYDDLIDYYDYTNMHELLTDLNKQINNQLGFLQHTLQSLAKTSKIFYSFKRIEYKDDFPIGRGGSSTPNREYINSPFRIINERNIRDKHAPKNDCIDIMYFDPDKHSPEEYSKLTNSLFFKCVTTGKIQISSEYSDDQRYICNDRYKSGFVAPVLIMGVPFALICFGSSKTSVFRDDLRELIATYSDAISEFFRLMVTYEHTVKAKTLIEYTTDKEEINSIEQASIDDKLEIYP